MGALGYPLKTILAYHADAANEVLPDGWAYCDGTVVVAANNSFGSDFTTPDLRNRMLLGGDITKAVDDAGTLLDNFNGAPGVTRIAGENEHAFADAEIPLHTHQQQISSGFTTYGGWGGGGARSGTQWAGNTRVSTSVGSRTPFDKRPRFYGVVWIIKVKH